MKFSKILPIAAIVIAIAVIAGGSYALSRRGSNNPGSCAVTGRLHTATIKNDRVSPRTTEAGRCDTLRIVNEDNITREIAFGDHDHHVPYDGITTRILQQGQSFTITLDAPGSYHFHDHFHDEVGGYFNVSNTKAL
jgi:plastocyanin